MGFDKTKRKPSMGKPRRDGSKPRPTKSDAKRKSGFKSFSGGPKEASFKTMGFSEGVYNGIKNIDYKNPTPIQREGIPHILAGKDVVAMARTGSGKTACFLLPLLERLRCHKPNSEPRALIVTPTKELAEQTLKFAEKLGKFTGLHCALIIGGESLDQQFGAMHKQPDLIIATPGRLVHLCVEMGRRLDAVEYVVFDEADRLFEMGFREQLDEILARLSPRRQTLLFSATMPQLLTDFAKAGLQTPTVIHLDRHESMSKDLRHAFFHVSPENKSHLLVYLLKHVVNQDQDQKVLVFAASMHCVLWLERILTKRDVRASYLYSDMDPSARRISAARFSKGQTRILVATDVAARGIDIPDLDYVINYNFPGTAKAFVHRVGRTARAGRSGIAFSMVSADEEAYLWDLHKFLGRAIDYTPPLEENEQQKAVTSDADWDFQYGAVPDLVLNDEGVKIDPILEDEDSQYLLDKCKKSYKMYKSCRPMPTKEAIRETKEQRQLFPLGPHPLLLDVLRQGRCGGRQADMDLMMRRLRLLEQIEASLSRPRKNVFEIGISGSRDSHRMMAQKRQRDDKYIASHREELAVKRQRLLLAKPSQPCQLPQADVTNLQLELTNANYEQYVAKQLSMTGEEEAAEKETDQEEEEVKKEEPVAMTSGKIRVGRSRRNKKGASKEQEKVEEEKEDEEAVTNYYMPYGDAEEHTERGHGIDESSGLSRGDHFEVTQDSHRSMMKVKMEKKKTMKGTRKEADKRIKTESGRYIQASFKTEAYERWLKTHKMGAKEVDTSGEAEGGEFKVVSGQKSGRHPLLKQTIEDQKKFTHIKEEVRNPEQIEKYRKKEAAKQEEIFKSKEFAKIKTNLLKKQKAKINKNKVSAVKSRNIQSQKKR